MSKVSIILKALTHMGDHDQYVTTAHEPEPGETVEQLAQRLLGTSLDPWGQPLIGRGTDHIELRLTVDPAPQLPPSDEPPY